MPCEVNYVPEIHTVVVVGSGRVTSQDAVQANARASSLLIENSATRVLADYSDAVVEVSTLDIHSLPQYSENLIVPKHIKIALVLPTTRYKAEDFQFYETVCRNRGYDCRLFTSRDPAMKWLEERNLS